VFTSLLIAAVFGLLVGDLVAYRNRRRLFRGGSAFLCRLRTCGYTSTAWPRLTRRWSRPMWAAWVGDELVVRRGPVFARAITLRAEISASGIRTLVPREARWCGARPVAVGLQVRDGSRMEVAADEKARLALVGPYLVAAADHRPRAPVPWRHN
jgi:hypothetical protein